MLSLVQTKYPRSELTHDRLGWVEKIISISLPSCRSWRSRSHPYRLWRRKGQCRCLEKSYNLQFFIAILRLFEYLTIVTRWPAELRLFVHTTPWRTQQHFLESPPRVFVKVRRSLSFENDGFQNQMQNLEEPLLNTSLFSDVDAILDDPKRETWTAEPLPLHISTHLRLRVIRNSRWVQTGESASLKTFPQKLTLCFGPTHLVFWSKQEHQGRSPILITAQATGLSFKPLCHTHSGINHDMNVPILLLMLLFVIKSFHSFIILSEYAYWNIIEWRYSFWETTIAIKVRQKVDIDRSDQHAVEKNPCESKKKNDGHCQGQRHGITKINKSTTRKLVSRNAIKKINPRSNRIN